MSASLQHVGSVPSRGADAGDVPLPGSSVGHVPPHGANVKNAASAGSGDPAYNGPGASRVGRVLSHGDDVGRLPSGGACPDDFDYAPCSQRGGLGKAHKLFGEQLPKLLDELNEVLAA